MKNFTLFTYTFILFILLLFAAQNTYSKEIPKTTAKYFKHEKNSLEDILRNDYVQYSAQLSKE